MDDGDTQLSTRRSKDVHCHEPLPGEEGIGTGVREGVAQPRLAVEQGTGLRRIPSAEGTRARGLHALCIAYGLAEPECLRSVDQVGGISCRPQGCRPEQAALHRPSAIRGFRGPADRTSRRNRGRLGFWKSLLAIVSVKSLLRPRIRKTPLRRPVRSGLHCGLKPSATRWPPRSRTCLTKVVSGSGPHHPARTKTRLNGNSRCQKSLFRPKISPSGTSKFAFWIKNPPAANQPWMIASLLLDRADSHLDCDAAVKE